MIPRRSSGTAHRQRFAPLGIIGAMNPKLSLLQPYPFERLRQLFAGVTPNPAHQAISLGIGEPKHATPALLKQALADALDTGLAGYPATGGESGLRAACAA